LIYRFGEFELDADRFELSRGGALLEVQPRVLEVLLHLVEHRDRLVPRTELLAAVWAGVRVEEASLYRAIAIARRLLGEAAGAPDPIRTLQGKGYRFAAPVAALEPGAGQGAGALPGRADALATLSQLLERARAGARQLVVVSGEAGIGKTSLLASFGSSLGPPEEIAFTAGQCLEPLESEPYSPLLEAVGRLCRRAGSDALETLRCRAPSWLAQLPAFGAEASGSSSGGARRGRRGSGSSRSWPTPSKTWPPGGPSCSCSRTSTGATGRPSACSPRWPSGRSRRGSSSSAACAPASPPPGPAPCGSCSPS